MNGVEMVVAIILIVTVGRIIQARYRYGTPQPQPVDDAESRRLREEVHHLKERIAVLERVITDNHSTVSLDREIDRLRDRT